jgi:hypothetical protein
VLDLMGRGAKDVAALGLDDDAHIAEAYKRTWQLESAWIYTYDVSVQGPCTKRVFYMYKRACV